jgi:cellobiose-specific phosphotransferase system component IIA
MKSLTIFIGMLVVTLILNGPIQSYADPQLDTLVNIATQAQNNLNMSISQIPNVSNEIISSYDQGSNETDALTKAVNAQNITSAKQHFLSAMNFFKITNDKIDSLNETETNDQQHVDVIQLQSEITRLEKFDKTLQSIAVTNHMDFNFTQSDQLIQKAKQDLDSGKTNETSELIVSANQFLNNAHDSLTEVAKQRTSDRAKDFTNKTNR